MAHERDTTVDDLNTFDYGKKLTIWSEAGRTSGRPGLVGKLIKVQEITEYKGMMPNIKYSIVIQRPGYGNLETHGPYAAAHPVSVGPEWEDLTEEQLEQRREESQKRRQERFRRQQMERQGVTYRSETDRNPFRQRTDEERRLGLR